MLKRLAVLVVVAGLAFVLAPRPTSSYQEPAQRALLVAATASLSGIAPQLAKTVLANTGIAVRFNFAASNTLARQIVEGARVDVFVSADEAQMDVVERAGRVAPGTRVDVIGNQLVVIASAAPSSFLRPEDLASSSVRRVAMGDPAAVPAGVYGRKWLETVRLWGAVQPKVVPLPSSPAVVAAIRAGRADAGIVYASDAKSHDVYVVHVVAAADAPRIVYPAAAIVGGRVPIAREFIAFLQSAAALRIFEAAGFKPLGAR
jgi:molybdate transport system substrate-binding protein